MNTVALVNTMVLPDLENIAGFDRIGTKIPAAVICHFTLKLISGCGGSFVDTKFVIFCNGKLHIDVISVPSSFERTTRYKLH